MSIISTKTLPLLIFNLVLILFWKFEAHSAPSTSSAPSTCTSYSYDCSYCARTECYCTETAVEDPDYKNRTIDTIEFKWSHDDTNKNNDECKADNGTCKCNKGVTSYYNNILPATQAACVWRDPKSLTAVITCSWQDGICATKCTKMVQQTCTGCR
ncbi:MAG: hypothetical protein RJB66_1405 [Pseudomonadota bacterium]|jgi:hypothetical protein